MSRIQESNQIEKNIQLQDYLQRLKENKIISNYLKVNSISKDAVPLFRPTSSKEQDQIIMEALDLHYIYYLMSTYLMICFRQNNAQSMEILNSVSIRKLGKEFIIEYKDNKGISIRELTINDDDRVGFLEMWASNYKIDRSTRAQFLTQLKASLEQNNFKFIWTWLEEQKSENLKSSYSIQEFGGQSGQLSSQTSGFLSGSLTSIDNFQGIIINPNGDILFTKITEGKNQMATQGKIYYNSYRNSRFRQVPNHLNNFIYEGGLNALGKPDGQGKLFYDNRNNIKIEVKFSVYLGEFKNGTYWGKGKEDVTKEILETYDGTFVNNQRHGQGKLVLGEETYEGTFRNDRKNGKFKVSRNGKIISQIFYKNDQEVQSEPNQTNENGEPSKFLFQFDDSIVNSETIKTLNEGQWVNQGIIDYYLAFVKEIYKKQRYDLKKMGKLQNQEQSKIYYISSMKFQDIFGSQISPNQNFQVNPQMITQKKTDNNSKELKDYDKVLITLNYNRSHFLLLVIEPQNQIVYQIDSIKGNNLEFLREPIIKLLKIETSLICKEFKELSVSQQPNACDCGVYMAYYAQQILRSFRKDNSIMMMHGEKKFSVDHQKILEFRVHMRNVIENNFASVDL